MKRVLSVGIAATVVVGLAALGAPMAQAAPLNPSKVTICHRTHSVTNPYRMITVSKDSVNGPLNPVAGGTPNTDADHAGHVHNGYARRWFDAAQVS